MDEDVPAAQRQFSNQFHRAGGGRGPIVKSIPGSISHGRQSSHVSATPARDLPGNISQEKMKGTSSRDGHVVPRTSFGQSHHTEEGVDSGNTRGQGGNMRRRSRLKTPQAIVSAYKNGQMMMAPGYDHTVFGQLTNGYSERNGSVRLARPIRQNDGSEHSSSSSLGDGEPAFHPGRLGPVKPKGKSSKRCTYNAAITLYRPCSLITSCIIIILFPLTEHQG